MSRDLLASATEAVRVAGDDDPGELAAATRARLRRSLEVRADGHRQLVAVGTLIATLILGGTVSWAITGHLPFVSREAPRPTTMAPEHSRAYAVAGPVHDAWPVEAPTKSAPPPTPLPPPAPVVPRPTAPVVAPAPRIAQRPRPTAIEALYRTAHELHFHGTDHAAALAAWDAYLAAEPAGRFSVEARFNRGIVLVRLGRYADAMAALEPFARGEVEPVGYRQHEAAQLVERLQVLNDPDGRGDYGR